MLEVVNANDVELSKESYSLNWLGKSYARLLTNQILNFVVETKNVDRKDSLREEEKRKIKHAEVLFNKISESVKVNFKTQFADDLVYDLIKQHI